MRIGIFDPAFRQEGHFPAFNRYIIDLFSVEGTEVTCIDVGNVMQETYKDEVWNAGAPTFVSFPTAPKASLKTLPQRMRWWHGLRKHIDAQGLDCLVITAEARDPLMYFFPPKTPYVALILYPYGYIGKTDGPKDLRGHIFNNAYRSYVRNSAVYLTTSESPILEDIQSRLSLPNLHWLPNLPMSNEQDMRPAARKTTFLSLGTISRTKNHLFVLSVFEKFSLPYTFKVVGKPGDEIGAAVVAKVETLRQRPNLAISGSFGYLSDAEYQDAFRETEYMVFPYDNTRGDITSQVLHDCFRTRTPIIAPAIEPFASYVERYGIGFTYPEGDAEACADVLKAASERSRESFVEAFSGLNADHSLESIRNRILPLFSQIDRRL